MSKRRVPRTKRPQPSPADKLTFLAAVGAVLFAATAAVYTYSALRHAGAGTAIASQPGAGDLPDIAPAAGGDDSDDSDDNAPDDDSNR